MQASFARTGSQARVRITGLASTEFSNHFQGFQEPFPKQDFQEHVFPKQNKVPRRGFLASVSKKRFPGRGVQARFPSKISRNMFFQTEQSSQNKFPNKCFRRSFQEEVSKQGSQQAGSQAVFSGRGSQARFLATSSQEQVPIQGSQEQVHKKGSQARSQARFPGRGCQARFPATGSQKQVHK